MHLIGFAMLLVLFAPLGIRQEAHELPSTSGKAFLCLCSPIEMQPEQESQSDYLHVISCAAYVDGISDGISQESAFAHAMTNKEPPRPTVWMSRNSVLPVTRQHCAFWGNRQNPAFP